MNQWKAEVEAKLQRLEKYAQETRDRVSELEQGSVEMPDPAPKRSLLRDILNPFGRD